MNREEQLLSLPYRQRQFIYIVDDYNGLQSRNGNFFQDAGDVVFNTFTDTLQDTWNPWRIGENWQQGKWWKLPLIGEVNLVTNAFEKIQGKIDEKDLSKIEVWKNEDIKPMVLDHNTKLKFQVGHPLKNTVYVAHPVKEGTYFPFANFHRFTFEHKWAEVMRLLRHLGAIEIKVIHKTGWKREFAANLNLGVPLDGIPVDSEVNYQSMGNSTSDIITEFHFPENNKVPKLPDNLVWYHHEETWKEIADGRLNSNLKDFSLELHYKEDFNVNASIRAKVQEYGLGLGGSFEKHESTTWILQGTFNSRKKHFWNI
ncbi:hypothetical protein [Heyndrickxia acidicola]|uniref:Uncharacterized protein n=1 Tax=Heyndrickxia acidicola TaxID=209389 RepID=A0ABU6MEU3_9BACI|nr:hypothetical protein [Heyndrickxia acidicola]MED1201782.1 hypothetical protein [Heyndrickxia acidicola]